MKSSKNYLRNKLKSNWKIWHKVFIFINYKVAQVKKLRVENW